MPFDTPRVLVQSRYGMSLITTDPRSGLSAGFEALTLAKRLDWRVGEAVAMNTIGVCYYMLAVNDSARNAFGAALKINESIGNRKRAAQNLGNLGNLAYEESKFPEALRFLFRALRIFEDIGDQQGIVDQLGNIGSIYQQQKHYAAALHHDSMALQIYRELGDVQGQALMLGNIGNVLDETGQTKLAIASDLRSIELYRSIGDDEGVSRNLSNLSEAYVTLNDELNAYRSIAQALSIQKRIDDFSGAATSRLNLGQFYLRRFTTKSTPLQIQGVPSDRRQCLDSALELLRSAGVAFESIGNLVGVAMASERLAAAYALAGHHKLAYEAVLRHKKFNDSAFSLESKIQIAGLETQRELELKDKQIELDRLAVAKKRNERAFFIGGLLLVIAIAGVVFRNYRQQRRLNAQLSIEKGNVERRTAELDLANTELTATLDNLRETQSQLVIAEKQKEAEMIRSRISQDIHDDISSELTRISWVSELAKAKASGADYDAMPGLLEKITRSSRETVTKLGEIIWTVNPKNDSLGSLLSYMRSHITTFLADSDFAYDVDFPAEGLSQSLHPELKRNLYLVLKEALNNAVKYSKGHRIDVSLSLRQSAFRLAVSDDGTGIDPGRVQGGGNGLGNMRNRMERIGGSCIISPGRHGCGTTLEFSGTLY